MIGAAVVATVGVAVVPVAAHFALAPADLLMLWFCMALAAPVVSAVHEGGHALAALCCGADVRRIQLGLRGTAVLRLRIRHTELVLCALPIGGLTQFSFERTPPTRPKIFAISVGGPAVNLIAACAGAAWLARHGISIPVLAFVFASAFGVLNLLVFGPIGTPWSQSDGGFAVRVWSWPDEFLEDFRVAAAVQSGTEALRARDFGAALDRANAAARRSSRAVAARLLRTDACIAAGRSAEALSAARCLRWGRYTARVRARAVAGLCGALLARATPPSLALADRISAAAMLCLPMFPEVQAARMLSLVYLDRRAEAEDLLRAARIRWPTMTHSLAVVEHVLAGRRSPLPIGADSSALGLAVRHLNSARPVAPTVEMS